MLMRLWSILSIGSFGALILIILFVTRKPLCIDSKLVEKIDRVSLASREEIYRCDLNRGVTYSSYWAQNVRPLGNRLSTIEPVLDRIGLVSQRKPNVIVLSEKSQVLYYNDSTIYLSEDLYLSPGILERELVRFWLKDKNEMLFSQNPLLADAIIENIIFLSVGKFHFKDYEVKNSSSNSYIWPQNLKSSMLECRYSKKFSDSISFCLTGGSQSLYPDMRPYFIQAWMESFEILKLSEKLKLIKDIVLQSPESVQKSVYGGRFLIELAGRLQKFGLNQSVENPEFDLVYELDNNLQDDGALKKSIKDFSAKNQDLKIAVIDSEKVLFLPTGISLDKKSLKSWKTKHFVYQSCGGMSFGKVSSFATVTDKILLIRSCNQNEVRTLQKYYQVGAEGFAMQNPELLFAHIHLPSLLLKETELSSDRDIFELLATDDGNSLKESFGWQQVVWNKQLKAFSPKAYVDAIDLFRIDKKSTN